MKKVSPKPTGVHFGHTNPKEKLIRGKDFPPGLEDFDLSWFDKLFTAERIALCADQDDFLELRAAAMFVLQMRELQARAQED